LPSIIKETYPQRPDSLRKARKDIFRFAVLCGVEHDEANDIVIAVGEALSNIVEHSGSSNDFTLRCECDGEKFTVCVEDRGKGMMSAPTIPNQPSWESRGLGSYLMNQLMDKVEVITKPGDGVVLWLEKRLTGAGLG
jgi:anti-sigma regulatory factor (Ser/Thr protein kinase)